ncbi:MAG: YjgP/YjgQ family permease [Firmicutes bacterium]|nr:YjgP/YjgQ family permease [Bacillota bacterium]
MKLIHRYVWNEFINQFLVCLLGFLALGIGKIVFDYNDLFIGYRVTPKLLAVLLVNQLPLLLMDIIPAAALFGVILFLGRMLRERELDVIRTNGLSLMKVMIPVFIGVLLICFAAFFWNDYVVPSANHRFEVELRKMSVKQDFPLFRENVVFKAPQDRFIYLKKVERKTGIIGGVLIIETGSKNNWPRIITAQKGKMQKGVWELEAGMVHEFDQEGALKSELKFEKMELMMSKDYRGFISEEKGPNEMRTTELLHMIDLYRRSGLNIPAYQVFYQSKFSDPIISLILVFLAAPLTMMTGRNSRWPGLVLCFLIIMGYYTLQVIGRTMGVNSIVAPWAAAWVPNLFFLVIGIFLLVITERW